MAEDYFISLQMIKFLVPETDLYNWHLARLEWFEKQIKGVIGKTDFDSQDAEFDSRPPPPKI